MELDMEMDEGQPQGCPFVLDESDEFGGEYAAGLPPVPDTGYFPGGSSSSRKNAKGGGQSAQLAFGSDKCRLSTNAFSQ